MAGAPDFLEFVWLKSFERQASGLLGEIDRMELETRLIENPEAGNVMPGTGGLRKMRVAAKGKGRRGGARVIYYLRSTRGRIYVITIYAKNVKEDLTAEERKHFKSLTAILDREG